MQIILAAIAALLVLFYLAACKAAGWADEDAERDVSSSEKIEKY